MKLRATKLLHNQISDPGRSHHELRTPKTCEAKGNKKSYTTRFVIQDVHIYELRTPKADGAKGSTTAT